VSDNEYDRLVELYFEKTGIKLELKDYYTYGNVIQLPYEMGSLDKLKTIDEIIKWLQSFDGRLFLSPKLDGISLEVGCGHAMTRGEDGINGTIVTNQFMLIQEAQKHLDTDTYFRGEAIICWSDFYEYFEPLNYAHPRNAVAGLFNSKNPDQELMKFVKFVPFRNCEDENWVSDIVTAIQREDLTHELLLKLFKSSISTVPCDGIVIEIKDSLTHLGNETNSLNPRYMRAYKHKSFDDVFESEVVEVIRQISKDGIYNPVLSIKKTVIGGAEIMRVNVDNELFVKLFGIGKGTKIGLKKSGGIIPRLVSVNDIEIPDRKELLKELKSKTISEVRQHYYFPTNFQDNYKEPEFEYEWNGVTIRRIGDENNREVSLKRMEHFLTSLSIKGLGEKTLEHIYNNHNVTTIKELVAFDFNKIIYDDGYGKVLAEKCKLSMIKGLSFVDEHILMSASGSFPKMGSNKLLIYLTDGIDAIGLGEYAAETIKNGLEEYSDFKSHLLSLGYKINDQINTDKNNNGNVYCPTNCRINGKLLDALREKGHMVKDSWSNSVTHVVRINESIVSNKVQKALEKNIPVITLKELMEEFLTENKTESLINQNLW
jgi:NAD-dependent DNA ligase